MKNTYFGIEAFSKVSQYRITKALRDKGIASLEGHLESTDTLVQASLSFNGSSYSGTGFRAETAVAQAYQSLLATYTNKKGADRMTRLHRNIVPLPQYEWISL